MKLKNCRYYKINLPIEKIADIDVDENVRYDSIESIEIGNEPPNVLIYLVNDKVPEYVNMYPSVKILITNNGGLEDGLWKEIPDHVEYVISNGRIRKNKNKFDFIKFEDNKKEIIEELIEKGRINECTTLGETVLYLACDYSLEEIALKLIDRMSDEAVNKIAHNGRSAFYVACCHRLSLVALKLIDRMNDIVVNKCTCEDTALYWACSNNMTDVAIKLIERTNDKIFNFIDYTEKTILYWPCRNKNTDMALKLIDRMNCKTINHWDRCGVTALYSACENNMTEVALKLIDRMSKKAINKKSTDNDTALDHAIKNNMTEVIQKINKLS